jgi:hypothetical protein
LESGGGWYSIVSFTSSICFKPGSNPQEGLEKSGGGQGDTEDSFTSNIYLLVIPGSNPQEGWRVEEGKATRSTPLLPISALYTWV